MIKKNDERRNAKKSPNVSILSDQEIEIMPVVKPKTNQNVKAAPFMKQ